MPIDHNQGNYLCRVCGEFFQAKSEIKVHCTYCKSNQLSVVAWDLVIQKRNQKLNFREENSDESLKVKPAGEDIVFEQLDIYGRKQRRKSLYILIFSLTWVVGIAVFAFKSFQDNDTEIITLDQKMALDGSLTKGKYNEIQSLGRNLFQLYKDFSIAPNSEQKAEYLYQWDAHKLNDFLNSSHGFISEKYQRANLALVHDNFAEVNLIAEDKTQQLLLFSNIDDQWQIDYDQFTNYNTMDFEDFINQKTETPHTFKLYFRATKSGLSQLITLIHAQPNNKNYEFNHAANITLNIKSDDPIYNELLHLIKIWSNYKQFNNTLGTANSSIIGELDPPNYNRVTLTLQHESHDGEMKLKIKKIKAAHWIGDYYKDFMTPAQKLTLPIL